MSRENSAPSFKFSTLLLAALSLSIGWGIRGNYGHEFGAMIPGALCAVAVCLLSGREDWQRRVFFFAMFGAIGWAFGGSMSYMQVMSSYTHVGNGGGRPDVEPYIVYLNRAYGFFAVFIIGFLWAALGGMGTAYPAVESRERLTAVFKPLCWILVFWALLYIVDEQFGVLDTWYQQWVYGAPVTADGQAADNRWFRQKSPFYWLDTDWLQALLALTAVCLYDLWNRRSWNTIILPVLAGGGGYGGYHLQKLLMGTESTAQWVHGFLKRWVIEYQGDIHTFDPANLLTNWPQLFFDLSDYLGLAFGVMLGIAIYFFFFGKWRNSAALPLYMAVGWFVGFLLMPVILTTFIQRYGGFRMTPPRGDNWAGLAGLLIGAMIYMYRNGLVAVNYAGLVSGLIGGMGFMFVPCLKLALISFGNPRLVTDPAVLAQWQHYQNANWHSIIIEQTAGLIYGLGLAVAIGMLATRTPRLTDDGSPVHRWTEAFSVSFLLNLVLFVNLVKMVKDWTAARTGGFRSVPEFMKTPLLDFDIRLDHVNLFGFDVHAWLLKALHFDLGQWRLVSGMSASGWFNLMFFLLTVLTIVLLRAHLRRPLAVVPASWIGKGQFLYLVFLWAIVIGNFMKALTGFEQQRLGTEAVIFVNAILATYLILRYAREDQTVPERPISSYAPLFSTAVTAGLIAVAIGVATFTTVVGSIYGDKWAGHAGTQYRFGPQAEWKVNPNLKHKAHN